MNHEFVQRFHAIWRRKRRVQVGQVVATTFLLSVLGFCALALLDYLWELTYLQRLIGLIVVAAGVLVYAARSWWQMMESWSQRATAAQIETTFPTLGQAVRTTVQFSALRPEQIQSAGVAVPLLSALAEQTHVQTLPLELDAVVPNHRMWATASGVIAALLFFAVAAGLNWEWRTASQRAALTELPYRSLLVKPGNVRVDEGQQAQIAVALIGRTNRDLVLYTRPADGQNREWTERVLEAEEDASSKPLPGSTKTSPAQTTSSGLPEMHRVARLNRLTKPVEYRVVAGELESPIYRIDIRSPLKLQQVQVDLTPPAYTGQPTSTTLDANLSVLQGTHLRFAVSFDKPLKSATLILAPRRALPDQEETPMPEEIPLKLTDSPGSAGDAATTKSADASLGVAEFTVHESRVYSIVAEAADGTRLVENKYRIRMREDQPPQVYFESPADSVEVHTLAELPMRIRVRDDYGVSKAGVVFQINNEQEVPLIAEDFATVAQAAKEVTESGRVAPSTQLALERILPLEHFELTQKDSVMYFAYAEDNLPERPQRTETDMRFIDIRPFKREYRVFDPDPMPGMGMGIAFKTLEELIQRQRFALNRTIQIEKRAAVGRKPDANSLDQLMKFETELAQFVRETAQGLESRGFDDTELFYQAEAAMLKAVDSLSVGKWDNATLQMRDALKFLIEQRDRTIMAILKNPDAAQLAALRNFDRQQAQKLRRPKSDKEEARELIRRLEQLVDQENELTTALAEPGPQAEPAAEKPTLEESQPSSNLTPTPDSQSKADPTKGSGA